VDTGYDEQVNAQRVRYQVGRAQTDQPTPDDIELNEDLGLACEKLPKGVDDIDMIWKIV
jgi:hypothetical protein